MRIPSYGFQTVSLIIRTRSQEVKMELVGIPGPSILIARCVAKFGQVSIHVFGLVGAVGSCLGGSVLVGRLAGVVAFGDIDP